MTLWRRQPATWSDTVNGITARSGDRLPERADAGDVQGTLHASPASLRSDRVLQVGTLLLVVQGLGMVAWSTVLWQRFALTWDYAIEHQAWWLIGHGDLDPFSTIFGAPFWRIHLVLINWLLAPLAVVAPHGPTLLWVQDLCLVGAEVVAWRWIREATAARGGRSGIALASIGLFLLLANPWAWWAVSFDYHIQLVAALFGTLAAYDLFHQRRRVWLWAALTILCGNVAATWIGGLGIAGLLAGARWRRQGAVMLLVGGGWVVTATLIHADLGGSVVRSYGYLTGSAPGATPNLAALASGVLSHPIHALTALWRHRGDIWANLVPGGLIGIASPWTLGMALPVLLADDLVMGNAFSRPGFQTVLLYVLVPLGTVLVLTRVHRRWPRLALAVGALAVANAAAWTLVWAPPIPSTWLRVSSASATVLARADAAIPASAEVVVSQGVVGRFSARRLVYAAMTAGQIVPLQRRDTWWVISPAVGIETIPSVDEFALVSELAGPLHARLVFSGHGVFVFRWVHPRQRTSLRIPNHVSDEQAWLFPGGAAAPVRTGPEPSWQLASNGRRGYVLARDYWPVKPGWYRAWVTLEANGPVNVEVWNATGSALLARRSIPKTGGVERLSFAVNATKVFPAHLFQGWGIFQAPPVPAAGGNQLEIRVWSRGHSHVQVTEIAMRPASRPAASGS